MRRIHLKGTVLVIMLITTMSICAQSKRDTKLEAANKKLVMEFYQSLFGDKDFTAIDKYLSKDYIQHNPNVADGSEPLKEGVKIWLKDVPKSKVDFQHTASEGDLVYLHIKSVGADGKVTAIMDIFRVENNKIVEHWDVIQAAPKVSANSHPMF
jgi:predicted SnoaL-like aldol condensation-catalyzing enzyme